MKYNPIKPTIVAITDPNAAMMLATLSIVIAFDPLSVKLT